MLCSGLRVRGLGVKVKGYRFEVKGVGSGCRVWGLQLG